jgi:hypothetical protein
VNADEHYLPVIGSAASDCRQVCAPWKLKSAVHDFLDGTFPPERRASDKPIAMACFLLVTFFPDRPLLSVPRFRSSIAFLTFSPAFFPYLAIGAP